MPEAFAVFRADASPTMGGGHVMRCLTLADALRDAGWTCAFAGISETPETIPALLAAGHDFVLLDETASDEQAILSRRWPHGCDLLIVDHYQRDIAFESACRPWASRIMVIDDLPNRRHDCDILLDQNLGCDSEDYSNLVPDNCRVLVGPANALLRPQFAAARLAVLARRQNCSLIERILVSLGATDPDNVTGWVIEALEYCGLEAEIDVMLGAHAPHLDAVKEALRKKLPGAKLHTDVSNVAVMMAAADLAIGGSGTTSWERCCLGLPSIAIPIAANQEKIAAELESAGAAYLLEPPGLVDPRALSEAVLDMERNPAALAEMSARAAALCDGRGTARVIEALAA